MHLQPNSGTLPARRRLDARSSPTFRITAPFQSGSTQGRALHPAVRLLPQAATRRSSPTCQIPSACAGRGVSGAEQSTSHQSFVKLAWISVTFVTQHWRDHPPSREASARPSAFARGFGATKVAGLPRPHGGARGSLRKNMHKCMSCCKPSFQLPFSGGFDSARGG